MLLYQERRVQNKNINNLRKKLNKQPILFMFKKTNYTRKAKYRCLYVIKSKKPNIYHI